MKRRCWFCRYRRENVALVLWKGHWRRACPTCQVHFREGVLKDPR